MTAPEGFTPEGAYTPGSLPSMQSLTEEKIRARLRQPVDDAMGQMASGLRDGLLAGVADALRGIVRAPLFQDVADAFEDGQAALRDRIDLFSSLEEQGTAFQSTNSPVSNVGKVPFDQKLTGSKGVSFSDGGIVLGDSGSWQINAMITADWIALNVNIFGEYLDTSKVKWEIRVLRPDGSLFHVKHGMFTGQGPRNASLFSNVTVPEPGYRVEVWVTEIAPFRGLLRGPAWNHLSVSHVNRMDSGGGATGAEPNDTPKG